MRKGKVDRLMAFFAVGMALRPATSAIQARLAALGLAPDLAQVAAAMPVPETTSAQQLTAIIRT